jgi:epimerase EvaD
MRLRKLAVTGAYEFTPTVYADDRGAFVSPLQGEVFHHAVGHRPFPLAQASLSRSRRGVVRGIHYCRTPPGLAQYVYCVRGRALDIAVDVRVGSPTFGEWDSVILDPVSFRASYLPIGVGHALVSLDEDTVVCYLLSGGYEPAHELFLNPLDPALGLPIPAEPAPILSDRDRAAPTLAEAHSRNLLPRYGDCIASTEGWLT